MRKMFSLEITPQFGEVGGRMENGDMLVVTSQSRIPIVQV